MPEISVIVPVYNVEPFLHRCVDSILAQTFTDFELILVDDGSPDNCGAICNEYASKDKRIHVIHQVNGGLSAARNAGINYAFANSDSRWLSFVDSDDWVHPQFLDLLLRGNLENGTQICACKFIRVEKTEDADSSPHELLPEVRTPEHIYTSGGEGVYAYAWNKLYSKELWRSIRFPEGRNWEDTATTYKVLFAVSELTFLDTGLYFYFINSDGIVRREWTKQKMDHFWALKQVMKDPLIHKYPTVVKLLWRKYINTFVEQIPQVGESTQISKKEKQFYRRRLQREFKWTLVTKGKKAGISLQTERWYYETAFPYASILYWTGVGICGKIKKVYKS